MSALPSSTARHVIDVGDHCVHCHASTAPGSTRYVNRVPADTTIDFGPVQVTFEGYACEECLAVACEECGTESTECSTNQTTGHYVCSDCDSILDTRAADRTTYGWMVEFRLPTIARVSVEATSAADALAMAPAALACAAEDDPLCAMVLEAFEEDSARVPRTAHIDYLLEDRAAEAS